MTDPELLALREAIDSIDQKLLDLLAERVRVVLAVGEYKRQRGVAVYDAERERRIFEALGERAQPPLDAPTVKRIFERIVDESRGIEHRYMTEAD